MRNQWMTFVAAGLLAGAVAAGTALAQKTPPAKPADPPPRAKARPDGAASTNDILEMLNNGDAAARQQAVEAIRARLTSRGLSELREYWLKPLTQQKMHKEIVDLATEGILASPWETRSVEQALQARIKSLIVLGKAEEALSDSKSLYNVASMPGTSEAILMVAEGLNAARADNVELFNKFRDEQMSGAALPTTQPTAPGQVPAGRKSAVLAEIKVNAAPYEEALKKATAEDPQSLMARGNLLLMADRVKDARTVFERMYSLSGAELSVASEALARCIKAEDGTIGRANAWILSIRPKKEAPMPAPR